MKSLMLYIVMILGIWSCGGGSAVGPTFDLQGYETSSIGSGAEFAEYKDQNGFLIAKGQVINGVRNGTWVTYHDGTTKVKRITNYIHGVRNGLDMTMNDRGQIETLEEYKNEVLHGMKSKYSFGRVTEEANYKDGLPDGIFAVYNNGKIQRKGSFKAGKQHGTLEYYDDKGNMTLQYEYKNGEKVSGGIVEQSAATE